MRQQVDKAWLRRTLNDGRSVRIEVASVSVEGEKSRVAEYTDIQGMDEPPLADEIIRDAVNFAAGIGGVQRFVVTAIDASDETTWRTAFNVDGGSQADGDATVSEPPNAIGLTSQLMRHLESKDRTINQMAGTYVHAMSDTIKDLRAENAMLRAKENERALMTEELISKKHARDLAGREVEAKIQREDEVWSTIKKWAPAVVPQIVSRLAGKDQTFVRPTISDIEVAALGVVEALEGEDIERIITAGVSPQKAAAIMALLEQVNKAKAISAKERAEIEARQEQQKWSGLNNNGSTGTSGTPS